MLLLCVSADVWVYGNHSCTLMYARSLLNHFDINYDSTGPTRTGTVSSISATSSTTSSPVDQIMGFFNTGAKGSVTNLSLGGGKKEYTVVITGASGMIGRALTKALQGGTIAGKSVKVVEISRRSGATSWDPATGAINAAALEGADAVVHLAGENVGSGSSESLTGRLGAWTEQKKERILNSRRDGTALLVRTIQGLKNPPKVFLTASAVGYYGFDEGDRVFDETGALGKGFLAEVTRVWEAEAAKLQGKRGIRVVNARFGVVLSKEGGIIKKLLPIFQLGGGGIIGDGQQYLSWISLIDAVRAIQFLLGASRLSGPVNVVAPEPATNAEFTAAMGKALFRPTVRELRYLLNLSSFHWLRRWLTGQTQQDRSHNPPLLTSSDFAFPCSCCATSFRGNGGRDASWRSEGHPEEVAGSRFHI